jgi:1-acyl-sn-glycerol-3-phosphate acyltransferase
VERILGKIRGSLKLFGAVFIVLAFFAKALLIQLQHHGDTIALRKGRSRNSQFFCHLMTKMFSVELTLRGAPLENSNLLIVGNHMGFVDIFILSSLFPALFVTSQEMRERPLLGEICELAGCIFVERRSRLKIVNELGSLVDSLKQGFNVVLYPEATSSDGVNILPFKKTLMMAGPQAGIPIQPACINYLEINGEPFSLSNRDTVCWYGEMSFVTAIWQSLTAKSIKAEVHFLEPIHGDANSDRNEIAHRAYTLVAGAFRPAQGGKVEDFEETEDIAAVD